ncbi:SDR family NAD(P)-dependent oxidoreductase [Sediminitomix flava]|uniref:3-oxoacyl-[acyl-carrier protein] reductase n=1 Tax=Sediminitomix flava TaxID=379075 RepID=A0A315ZX84_SEDFL|nr:SDR family oxidoreductase [Sediminitomix flava]PWJ41947.1 3-oxoacyl-[acyl-carrier protein] reductase [Sediminitomix flava]
MSLNEIRGDGKIMVITGASKGIGKQISIDFIERGFKVFGIARSEEKLNETAQRLNPISRGEFIPMPYDIGNETQIETLIEKLYSKIPKIDVLILCAGIAHSRIFEDLSLKDIQIELKVNYTSHIFLIQKLEELLKKSSSPRIIAIGSLTSELPFPTNASYSASKAALFQFLRSWRMENPFFEDKVKIILPGFVKTHIASEYDMHKYMPQESTKEVSHACLKALQSHKSVLFPSWTTACAYRLGRFSLSLSEWLIKLGSKYFVINKKYPPKS